MSHCQQLRTSYEAAPRSGPDQLKKQEKSNLKKKCPPAHLSFVLAGTSMANISTSCENGPVDDGKLPFLFFSFLFLQHCVAACVKRVLSEKSHSGSVKPGLPAGMKIPERCSALAWLNTERCQSPAPMIKIGSSPLDLFYPLFFGGDTILA